MDLTVVSLYMFARMYKYGGVRLHAFVSHIYLTRVCVCLCVFMMLHVSLQLC